MRGNFRGNGFVSYGRSSNASGRSQIALRSDECVVNVPGMEMCRMGDSWIMVKCAIGIWQSGEISCKNLYTMLKMDLLR